MTRINTNVSSLNAQNSLARSNASLQQALTRLSTGVRINSGKDDPAGLIASEVLSSDIISTGRAVTNSERANQMIATADSALGQVSNLLNDIRGLISLAANRGTMSPEQIAANQLQIDSSLEAIDRIATITQFQGRRLLDGNLDFVTKGVDDTKITDLAIDQASFGVQPEIPVAVDIVKQATRGQLRYPFGAIPNKMVLVIGGKDGHEAFNFAAGSKIEDLAAAVNLVSDSLGVCAEVLTGPTQGAITVSSYGDNNDIVLQAKAPGELAGNYRVKFVANPLGGPLGVSYTAPTATDPGTITVNLQTQAWTPAQVTIDDGSSANNGLVFTSRLSGQQFNGVQIVSDGTATAGSESVSYDHDLGQLTLRFASGVTRASDLISVLNSDPTVSQLFSVTNLGDSDGSGTLNASDSAWTNQSFSGGVNGGAVLSTANDVVDAINHTAGLATSVGASVATGDDGYGIVSPFADYASYGSANSNDGLQFLAPAGTPDIRFVSQPGQSLGIDLTTDPRIDDFSSATVQGTAADTSLKLTALTRGSQYDGVAIQYIDTGAAGQDAVVWDPENKVVRVFVQQGVATAADVANLINNDSYVSSFFHAQSLGTGGGVGTIAAADFGTNLATTSGGVLDEGTILINLGTDSDGVVTTTAQDLVSFFNDPANAAVVQSLGISANNAALSNGSGLLAPTTMDIAFATSGTNPQDVQATATLTAVNGSDALIKITALEPGALYGGVRVVFEDTAPAKGSETAAYDPVSKVLTVGIKQGATNAADVISAINNDPIVGPLFLAENGVDRSGTTSTGVGLVSTADGGTLSSGVQDMGTQDGAAFVGNEDNADTGLLFLSTTYGSQSYVEVKALTGGPFTLTDPLGNVAERAEGTDIDARINGIPGIGDGLKAMIHSSALDMTLAMASTLEDGDSTAFTIVGGGAQFQLGPDVVSSQQARLGIASLSTGTLGGSSGRLFELKSGGPKALNADIGGAAAIADEVIGQITTLRGRLGAFQRTTLETNVNALNDTLESLTDAESSIRDADFAVETAALTRAQILVKSGVSVLSIANSNPQNVLALLQQQ